MNFVTSERAWRALSAEADFRVEKELPKKNVLIIAPHPDDEVFGCFSAIVGQKASVVYLFAGDKSGSAQKDREKESKEVGKSHNLEQLFIGQPDNSIISKDVITQLSEMISGAEIIFLPSFSDPNIDHRETVSATVEALKLAKIKGADLKKIQIWLYEIWNSLPYFNRLVEIDWEEKKKAMEKFESQKSERNYVKAIKSLNDYRGEMYGLSSPAEAFFALPADLLLKLNL